MHGSLLEDASCPERLLPIIGQSSDDEPTVIALQKCLLNTGLLGTRGKDVSGIFVGRVQTDKSRKSPRFLLVTIRDFKCNLSIDH
jgi:hypothetical protein